ncbi:heme peroxidase [Wallemia mellicola CBS 633.66]|uniref:Heme peroxidase n=1 Tax=Wallemia mellicola (strain ATCC MYA-4683 / CBS 633.66) TaxID=671144 RepID=I4YCG3_WALMC|nr:heme peroxidase [Wallemia mellicola CBS 633.66]EIM21655.1 heme peroxidase [Wallemia mellicola CBS 633.66]TIB93451.1 heme peroxidase [Wallemia mellicola]|eukprot:XP_006958244.1 heme peroxidase [Wallemia mellicola CBS 633.66]
MAPNDKNKQSLLKPVWNLLGNLKSQIAQGKFFQDVGVLHDLLKTAANGGAQNDREFLLERMVGILSTIPSTPENDRLTGKFIQMLWQDLPHPPLNYVGDVPFNGNEHVSGSLRIRHADGSLNNPFLPSLGKANTPYARNVALKHVYTQPLPSEEDVFNKLLRRKEGDFLAHPTGLSSLFFNFATCVIHTIFRTDTKNSAVNGTSSYMDLAIVYGNNVEEEHSVRSFENGHLKPDTISESRLFMMPPAITTLLILLNRNHNYICENIFRENEKKWYKPWAELDDENKKKQDEDIFHTAKLINCGFFANIVLHDYLRAILGLTRSKSTWVLDPRAEVHNMGQPPLETGTGGAVSIEFNVLYRWHSVLSKSDTEWTENFFKKMFGDDVDFDKITPREFGQKAYGLIQASGNEPSERNIPGLSRQENGTFKNEDLVGVLKQAIDEPAGSFRARGTPSVLRVVDIMGMKQAREVWGLCTMNEFRKAMSLTQFKSFEEWNSDKEVAQAARELYGHIDNLELYPGLLAEEQKPPIEGSGLCPGYTVSRAILSDAVSLVRGDRFLTNECTPQALTTWGYNYIQPDNSNKAFGGMLVTLLENTLPNTLDKDSVYALFPFNTPETMKKNLTKLKIEKEYKFTTN